MKKVLILALLWSSLTYSMDYEDIEEAYEISKNEGSAYRSHSLELAELYAQAEGLFPRHASIDREKETTTQGADTYEPYEDLEADGYTTSVYSELGQQDSFDESDKETSTKKRPRENDNEESAQPKRKRIPLCDTKCQVCNHIFAHKCDLIRHMRTHTGERPFRCKICDRAFALNGTLTTHMQKIHGKESRFVTYKHCHCATRKY